jgi:hypothetical protein
MEYYILSSIFSGYIQFRGFNVALYENIVVQAFSLRMQTGGPHHNFSCLVVTNRSWWYK